MGESMRRFIAILTAMILLTLTAGCTTIITPVETEASTEAPTDAPYIDTQLSEPEWTLAEGELQLEDGTRVVAVSDDILYFAIVTDENGEQELRFHFSEEMTATLKEQTPDVQCYMTLGGEKIGNATISDDCTVAIISAENAADEITALATKIRGLYE